MFDSRRLRSAAPIFACALGLIVWSWVYLITNAIFDFGPAWRWVSGGSLILMGAIAMVVTSSIISKAWNDVNWEDIERQAQEHELKEEEIRYRGLNLDPAMVEGERVGVLRYARDAGMAMDLALEVNAEGLLECVLTIDTGRGKLREVLDHPAEWRERLEERGL